MKKGFTIIELLVVIAIIGVLSAILMVNFSSSRAHARDAQRISDVSQIQLALSLYGDRCNQYPASLALAANSGCPGSVTLGSFISAIPTPPTGASQNSYDYATSSSSGIVVNYVLHAKLEYTNAAVVKGLNAIPSGTWSFGTWANPHTCDNSSTSVNYCVSAN
jgi:general secretion pathway protein G